MKNAMRCAKCSSMTYLSTMQVINSEGFTIGILFVCDVCLIDARGKEVKIEMTDKKSGIDLAVFSDGKTFQKGEIEQ